MIEAISPRQDCGKVSINEDHITWEANAVPLLKIDISKIAALGEYTTVHALHRNEWFIVFIFDENETYQVSTYAEGMQEVLEKLSGLLNCEISPKLALESDFKSNILWPQELSGTQLYQLKVMEPKSFFDRFRARLGFGSPLELVLNEPLLESIRG